MALCVCVSLCVCLCVCVCACECVYLCAVVRVRAWARVRVSVRECIHFVQPRSVPEHTQSLAAVLHWDLVDRLVI